MVMTRDTFIAAGGFDERFIGWGGDDDAFMVTLETLCGNYIKLDREVIHLWHPGMYWDIAPNKDGNAALLNRYWQAYNNKEEILKLINERKVK